eukprot:g3184.t1
MLSDSDLRESISRIEKVLGAPSAVYENDIQKTKEWKAEVAYRRSQLAIGLNEVTRALEKDQAKLVLYCSKVKPASIVAHLPMLASSKRVPICAFPKPYASVVLGKALSFGGKQPKRMDKGRGSRKSEAHSGSRFSRREKQKGAMDKAITIAVLKTSRDQSVTSLCNFFFDIIDRSSHEHKSNK